MNALILALAAVLAVSASAPVSEEPIPIVSQTQDGPNADGTFNSAFETGNGIQSQQQGSLKQIDENTFVQVVQGSAAWTAPDGTPIQLTYIADENGYQPQGNAIPTPGPIPEAIQKSLDYIAAHPPAPEQQPSGVESF